MSSGWAYGTGAGFTGGGGSQNIAAHHNPMLDYLQGFQARDLKTLFLWCEYLFYQSPHIFAATRKFSEYPITELVYKTKSAKLKDRYEDVMENQLDIKAALQRAAMDRQVYGNYFASPYFPFQRFLICPHCKAKTNIEKVEYAYSWASITFNYTCPACDRKAVAATCEDRDVLDVARFTIIRWDPKYMDIDYNPLSGESIYYYTIPGHVKESIKRGNKLLINTTPMSFLECIKDGMLHRFHKNRLFHIKTRAPAGITMAWGMPPIVATLKQFFYTAILRKANEAIAFEYLIPFRIIAPAMSSPNADPAVTMQMSKFMNNFKDEFSKWRKDPLHLMFAPFKVETSYVGGQGRTLMTIAEIQEAENNIIAAQGIPREFLFGGLSFTGSAITLRILENQLQNDTADLNKLLQRVGDWIAEYFRWRRIGIELMPFKLIDDVQQKQLLLMLAQGATGQPVVSSTTLLDSIGKDIDDERKRRMNETIQEARMQMNLETELASLQSNVALQAQQNAAMGQAGGGVGSYDQQAIIAEADMLVQELAMMDPGQKQSILDSLATEDAVFHAVVVQRLQQMQQNMTADAKAQTMGGGGGAPPAGGGEAPPGGM